MALTNRIKPVALVILDGFGYQKKTVANAIAQANTPNLLFFKNNYPHTLLNASGKAVGLPEGFVGNSEVGHLTIGAGRIIEQPLTKIFKEIEQNTLEKNPALQEKLTLLERSKKNIHLMGLLSDAGIHSHTELLYALLKIIKKYAIAKVIIHPFLDGRDVAPQSAALYLEQLDTFLKEQHIGVIGSVHGRWYAMDRNNHWQRTQASYAVLTQETSMHRTWQEVLKSSYAADITDEYIVPTALHPQSMVAPGDGIIFFNIRADRARQLTEAFIDPDFAHFPRKYIPLSFFITPVSYGNQLKTDVLLQRPPIKNTLKEVIAQADKTLFSIAETEKYAHVTYFFAGEQEQIFPHEIRMLIPSLPLKNYVHHPEMSAPAITQAIVNSINKNPKDFYLINYANADMVGHSGDLAATIKAIECLDQQLGKLYEIIVQRMGGSLYIVGDHGKAEMMIDQSGQPCTAHTANKVPFFAIASDLKQARYQLPLEQLSDIAPFILQRMNLPLPEEIPFSKSK